MPFYNWSTTANTNASADSTINWAEGQAPSSVNDSARAVMARLREYGNDIAGNITTGGSATAYTVSSNQVFDTLAHLAGQVIGFVPHATNTNTVGNDVTLNVDGLGAKPIRAQPSVALPNGSLILGTPYIVVYNNSDAVFYLHGLATNPYSVPLAGGMDYWGSSTPNSSFAFPTGQAISRTTYATLFAIVGTTYGTGDGSTTFNLPDKTGRVSAMKEASVSRMDANGWSGNSSILGSASGISGPVLVTGNLPPYTPAGSVSTSGTLGGTNTTSGGLNAGGTSFLITQQGISSTFTGTAQGGTSQPVKNIQPTIICNYIIRII